MPLATEFASAMERACGACDVGTGEVYMAVSPTFPSFQLVHDNLPPEQMPTDHSGAGKDVRSPRGCPACAHGRARARARAQSSAAIEAEMFAEFAERLARNTGRLGLDGPNAPGATLWSRSRVKDSPRRPSGGWGLLVKPLGGGGAAGGISERDERRRAEAFVAAPDGTRRPLNAHEAELLRRQRVRPRRRLE